MRAVRLYEYGGPEKLRYEEDVPEPDLDANAVLIAATATSINPIDWKIRSGARQKDFPLSLPAILGRDVSGVVETVGSNVRHFRPGDRVVAMGNATYAERVAVQASVVTHVPEGVDLHDVAALPLIVLTGDQLVRLAARVQAGQTVLVTGALGSVGRAAVHSAMKLGARVVAGVRARQLDEARSLGAAGTVAIDDEAALAALPPVDAVADTVGGETAARVLARVREGGVFGYASTLPDEARRLHPSVTVTRVFARPDASKVREFADDVRDGRFTLPIGRRLALRETAEAHVLAERGGAGKILLTIR
jgi:NADPH:quinone reductase-like Zn-dependent oxidoreductase